MAYPYPIRDWTRPEQYPETADALSPTEWAWEFLRRDSAYQEAWDRFAALPDTLTLPDGSQTVKNGKWKGSPWRPFRFLCDGAGWYADPPPIPGEWSDDYEARTGGAIMPFAEWFRVRFKIDRPGDPRAPLPEGASFVNGWEDREDLPPPWPLDIRPPGPDALECEHTAYRDRMRGIDGPYRVALVFDLRYPLDRQATAALELLAGERDALHADRPGFEPIKPQYQPGPFPHYIRVLDGAAAGAKPPTLAARIFPNESNGRADGWRVSEKVRKQLERARSLCAGGYWQMLTKP